MKEYLLKSLKNVLKFYSIILIIIIIFSYYWLKRNEYNADFYGITNCLIAILFKFNVPVFFLRSNILVALYFVSPYFLLLFFKSHINSSQLQALINLGLGLKIQGKSKEMDKFIQPEVKKYKDHIQVSTPNLIIKLDEIIKDKESFESIFNSTFAEIKKTKGKKQQFHLYYDFFATVNANDFVSPPEYSVYFGKTNTGDDVVMSLRDAFSGYIAGMSGAGKTTLLINYFKIMKAVDPDFIIVIFDAKGLDYDPDFLEKYNITYFFMGTTEELEIARDYLEALRVHLTTVDKKLLNEHRVKHTEDLRKLGIPSKRYMLLFDEATQFLNPAGGSKEFISVKKELIVLVEKFLALGRAYGVCTWISTQRLEQDELGVSTSNISFRLVNGIESEVMSKKYTNGQVGPEPVLSRWWIRCSAYKGFIKTPFLPEDTYLKSSSDRPEEQD